MSTVPSPSHLRSPHQQTACYFPTTDVLEVGDKHPQQTNALTSEQHFFRTDRDISATYIQPLRIKGMCEYVQPFPT